MKKKKAKARKQKVKKEIIEEGYPKQLAREQYFACPVWYADQDKYVKELNKSFNKIINDKLKPLKKY